MSDQPIRVCKRCTKDLPPDAFYKRTGGGLHTMCITCYRDEARARETRSRRENPARHRARWLREARARKGTPKVVARDQVRAAVAAGRLGKPPACEECGTVARLHGHHHDYARPLDVQWLCPKCHGEAHRKLGWR